MVSRSTIAASLVVVVLLAGCSGLVGDDGTGSASSPDEFEYADGFSADGVSDGAADSYRNALSNASSYTVDYQQNLSGNGSEVSYDIHYRVDGDDERAVHRFASPSQDYEADTYYGSDGHVTRQVSGDQEQVTSGEEGFQQADLTAARAIDPLLANTTAYDTSVAERDGTEVVVYETSGAENAEAVFGVDQSNVSEFSAEFAVDADGVVHDATYDITYLDAEGNEQTLTLSFEVSAVGDTSVERPGWADEA